MRPLKHMINGQHARAEMHMVHADENGDPRSVVALLILPAISNETSAFFDQLPESFPAIGSEDSETLELDPSLALDDIGSLKRFWTYKGSLTTPPCTEGLRWFVSQTPLYVDNETIQKILGASRYVQLMIRRILRRGDEAHMPSTSKPRPPELPL